MKINPYLIPGLKTNPAYLSDEVIIKIVCNYFKVDFNNLTQKSRKAEFVIPRQVIMYFLKKRTNKSLHEIAEIFNRKHPIVIHSCGVVENYYETDKNFKNKFDELKKLLCL